METPRKKLVEAIDRYRKVIERAKSEAKKE